MAGSGTGFPLNFRCWRCRREATLPKHLRYRKGYDVELTGRKRKTKASYCARADQYKREYRCLACGHVGWSNHSNLKYQEEHERARQQVPEN